jgi:hypothetical protein
MCAFGKSAVDLFGHRVSAAGPNLSAPMWRPQNIKELQRFLGMVNFIADLFLPPPTSCFPS